MDPMELLIISIVSVTAFLWIVGGIAFVIARRIDKKRDKNRKA